MPETLEGGTAMVKYKTADESNSTTTLDDVDEMFFDVDPGQEYEFEFDVPYSSAASGTGLGLAISGPATPDYLTYSVQIFGVTSDGASASFIGAGTASDDVVQGPSVQQANLVYIARVNGILKNGPNAGQIKLRFKSEIAASAVTIKAGCIGKIFPSAV
jgi:hypothetical protein